MNLHTASSAVMRNEAEREQDKRQGVGEGKGARGLAVAVAGCSVRGQLSFCVGVQNIFIWPLCADARSIFRAGPPRGPSVQAALRVAHPNSPQTAAHDRTTEENHAGEQRCITAPRLHTEPLKPRGTRRSDSRIHREGLQVRSKERKTPRDPISAAILPLLCISLFSYTLTVQRGTSQVRIKLHTDVVLMEGTINIDDLITEWTL